jgi:uncharacterized membrane protein
MIREILALLLVNYAVCLAPAPTTETIFSKTFKNNATKTAAIATAMIKMYDVDKSGNLSSVECSRMNLRSAGFLVPGSSLNFQYLEFDANNDGVLTAAELADGITAKLSSVSQEDILKAAEENQSSVNKTAITESAKRILAGQFNETCKEEMVNDKIDLYFDMFKNCTKDADECISDLCDYQKQNKGNGTTAVNEALAEKSRNIHKQAVVASSLTLAFFGLTVLAVVLTSATALAAFWPAIVSSIHSGAIAAGAFASVSLATLSLTLFFAVLSVLASLLFFIFAIIAIVKTVQAAKIANTINS